MRTISVLVLMIAVVACSTSGAEPTPDRPPAREADGTCDAAPAQSHVGKQASSAVGASILADSGARILRWGPPNSAWTADYRQDRVGVRYDDNMTITQITCG